MADAELVGDVIPAARQAVDSDVVESDMTGSRGTDDGARFLKRLRSCIEKLPPKQRSIIRADLQSGDVADAGDLADSLKTSKNSIYASRSIARKSLKRCLVKSGESGDQEET